MLCLVCLYFIDVGKRLTRLECDKAFTRSDALVKHMRTVHETDAIRPIDLSTKASSLATAKPAKIKLTFKKGQAATNGHDPEDDVANGVDNNLFSYPANLNFTEEELAMAPEQLCRLLRRQLYWSQQEGERLRQECAELEAEQKKEWINKELLLANIVEAELASAVHNHRNTEEESVLGMVTHLLPNHMMPVSGEAPWYRKAPTDFD